jgi:hypothetical protein
MRERRFDRGGLIFGGLLLLVGGYFLLRESFGIELPEIDWDLIWPIGIILLGVAVIWGARNRRSPG